MQFTLKTLTPLWTGGVNPSEMERLQEKGLIGSLRWWDEAILRGLGQRVCNPTSDDNRCPDKDDNYCEVCDLYGATGLRRNFRLQVQDDGGALDFDRISLPSGRIHEDGRTGRKRIGGWYLQGQAQMKDGLKLAVISLGDGNRLARIPLVLGLIERHAAIGAKVSNGYGVIEVTERKDVPAITSDLVSRLPHGGKLSQDSLPDIRDFFFAKLTFQEPNTRDWWQKIGGIAENWKGKVMDRGITMNVYKRDEQENRKALLQAQGALQRLVNGVNNGKQKFIPIASAVRNWLRYQWEVELTEAQEDFLFGTTSAVCPLCLFEPRGGRFQNDRYKKRHYYCHECNQSFPEGEEFKSLASKINVSHAYQTSPGEWEFRVWGWLPDMLSERLGLQRSDFLPKLQAALVSIPLADQVTLTLKEWHPRDSAYPDGMKYLKELIEADKGGGK